MSNREPDAAADPAPAGPDPGAGSAEAVVEAPQPRDHALLVGAALAFALMAVFTREAAAPVLAVAAWRAVIVALSFGVWSALVARERLFAQLQSAEVRRIGVLYGVALALASSTYVGGYALTTVANTVFLHSLAPVAVFPLAWWAFRERASARALAGTAVAVVGVALLSGVSLLHVAQNTDSRFLIGDGLALLSAVGYGGVLVVTRMARKAAAPMVPTLFLAWSVAAVLLCAVALAFGDLALPTRALGWVAALALVSTTLPFYLLSLGMRRVPAGLAALLGMSEVVFATAIGLALYGETLAPVGWIGAVLVVAGIVAPFADDAPASEDAPVPEDELPWRQARLALGVLLLNVGAGFALLGVDEAGVLLVWLALASLARLGVPLLGGAPWHGRAAAALAALVLAGIGARSGLGSGGADLSLAAIALAACAADVALAQRDTAGGGRFAALALGLLGAGSALTAWGHAAGPVLRGAAAVCVALEGVLAVLSALRMPAAARLLDAPARIPSRWALLAGAALLAGGGIRQVPAGHVAIVERFGSPLAEPVAAGLALRLPPPIEQLIVVDTVSVRRTEVRASDEPLLSSDEALVSVDAVVHWTVGDAAAFALRAADPEQTLRAAARAALVATIARRSLDDILTVGRNEIERQVADNARAALTLAGSGVEVLDVALTRVAVPATAQPAFLEVTSAEEKKRELANAAEAYAAQILPRARGTAAEVREAASGQGAARLAEAEARAALVRGLSEGGRSAPGLAREVLWRRELAHDLAEHRLILVPDTIRAWSGGAPAEPVDVPAKESR